jgi:hypothetical protein
MDLCAQQMVRAFTQRMPPVQYVIIGVSLGLSARISSSTPQLSRNVVVLRGIAPSKSPTYPNQESDVREEMFTM